MGRESLIGTALADLDSQAVPNYSQAEKKYHIHRTVLMRRHKDISTSRKEAISIHRKKLTDEQEEALLL
jgi:hypothetical protein